MPRSILSLIFLLLSGFLLTSPLLAQEVYVKDTLRVGVRDTPGNSSAPFSVVTTGMKLSILERSGDFIKVKLPSGTEGWIKATYVSDEPPATIKLEELQQQFQEIQTGLKEQEQRARAADLNNKNLNAEIEQLKQKNAELRVQLEQELESQDSATYAYLWKILILLAMGVGGFAVGATWYRKQTMRRLGGLRP